MSASQIVGVDPTLEAESNKKIKGFYDKEAAEKPAVVKKKGGLFEYFERQEKEKQEYEMRKMEKMNELHNKRMMAKQKKNEAEQARNST